MTLTQNILNLNRSKGVVLFHDENFDVELISTLVQNMVNGKAARLDELSAEHIKYCHIIIMCILCKLFNLFIMTGHIPEDFEAGYTIPIPKCDGRVRTLSVDDFRGISISPVRSKLFKLHASQNKFVPFIYTFDQQLGFVKHIGCNQAIYYKRHREIYSKSLNS
jgi:hypothetical protein